MSVVQRVFAGGAAIALMFGCYFGAAAPAKAEVTISGYTGYSFSLDSDVDYDFNDGLGKRTEKVEWWGESFSSPLYYGARITYWFDSHPNWGVALGYTHAKVKSRSARFGPAPLVSDFGTLQFTNGINFGMANVLYRHQNESRFTPYGGIGAGISVPMVEVGDVARTTVTYEHQLAGPAIQAFAGVDMRVWNRVSVFTEFRSTYSFNDAELTGGGSLQTNILTNQIMLGFTLKVFD